MYTSNDEGICDNERAVNELHFRPLLIAQKELSKESTAFSIPLSMYLHSSSFFKHCTVYFYYETMYSLLMGIWILYLQKKSYLHTQTISIFIREDKTYNLFPAGAEIS